jgi:hypothetical protein
MSKKTNGLQMEFEMAGHELKHAAVRYAEAAAALMAGQTVAQRAATVKTATCVAKSAQRELLNRLVRNLAVQQCGGDFRRAWGALYDRMMRMTGFNPCAYQASVTAPHLDVVEEHGMLDRAVEVCRTFFAGSPLPAAA